MQPFVRIFAWSLALLLLAVSGCNRQNTVPKAQTEGGEKSSTTEESASTTPIKQINIYLIGFHPIKDDPKTQMEAHHYCHQANEDFVQCVLFDGNTKDAQMNGIEYIISEKVYNTLPADEKRYWHPHNFEILSGQLVAPGLPDQAEHNLMAQKMNSYGKTWHLWMTEAQGKPGDKLPLGPPRLAWSLNHDGEAVLGLIEAHDKRLGIDTATKRNKRQDLAQYAHPQGGVDALKSAFPNARGAPQGVKGLRQSAQQE
jgi:Protein of unknown function (DUF1264)